MDSKTEIRPFKLPPIDGKTLTVRVPMTWHAGIKKWIITPEAARILEDAQAKRLGAILPSELLDLRNRLGYTQKEMARLINVGEKTWTRWESGWNRPTES